MPRISESYVGEVDDGFARLWYHDGAGVRQEVPHVVSDSPVGLAWGFSGKGPADTARSILAAETGSAATAERFYEAFTIEVVSELPLNERFALSRMQVRSWLAARAPDVALEPPRRQTSAQAFDDGEPVAGNLDREAAQLAARSRALDERERRVTEREARVDALALSVGLVPEVAQATWLPADPVRHQLEALVTDSGDNIAEVARANNLDPKWATALVEGKTTKVDVAHVRQVCAGLRCTPYDMWGTAGARSVACAYGPGEWPVETEPLVPVDGVDVTAAPDFSVPSPDTWPAPKVPTADRGPELAPELTR